MERYILPIIYGFSFAIILYMQMLVTRISRKNIFLGVRLPVEIIESGNLKNIENDYKKYTLLVGLISGLFLIFMSYKFQNNLRFIILIPFIYMAVLFLVYFKYNKKVRLLKEKEDWENIMENKMAVSTDYIVEKRPESFFSWAKVPLLIFLLGLIIGLYFYPRLNSPIAIHWDFYGRADGFSEKNILSVFGPNIVQLFMIVIFYISYYSMMRSKLEIDIKNPEVSIEKHRRFTSAWNLFLKLSLIGLQIIFSIVSLATYGLIDDLRPFSFLIIIYSIFMILSSIYLGKKYGQGGDRLEINGEEVSGTFRDDDNKWIVGNTLYYNKEDPSLFVEKRVGVGWTINLARPLSKLIILLTLLPLVILFLI